MPRIDPESTRHLPEPTARTDSRGRARPSVLPDLPVECVEADDDGPKERIELAPFGQARDPAQAAEHTDTDIKQPSVPDVLTFFKHGTSTTPPPSSGRIIQGSAKRHDLPPIAPLLRASPSGPIRTQTRHKTPSVADYTRPTSFHTKAPGKKGVKVDGGDDLLSFLATVSPKSALLEKADTDSVSAETDSRFEEEVDELESDSESGSVCGASSRSNLLDSSAKLTEPGLSEDASALAPSPSPTPDPTSVEPTPPPSFTEFQLQTSPLPTPLLSLLHTLTLHPIKAIPTPLTAEYAPHFPWEFYACDIQRGLMLFDACVAQIAGVKGVEEREGVVKALRGVLEARSGSSGLGNANPSESLTSKPKTKRNSKPAPPASLLLPLIFDTTPTAYSTFKLRRPEIDGSPYHRLILDKYAKMGRVEGASFVCFIREVRGDPWFRPGMVSSVNRVRRG